MRLAGMTEGGPEGLLRAAGCCLSQTDWPWWVDRVVAWQRMVKAIYERSGRIGEMYRTMVEQVLAFKQSHMDTDARSGKTRKVWGPPAIYGLFEDFIRQCEHEDKR